MFKKVIALSLVIGIILTGIPLSLVISNAGTDPEPLVLLPTDDAYVFQQSYQNCNNKNYNGIGENLQLVGLSEQYQNAKVAYMKFDISGIGTSEINTAILRIYAKNSRVSKDRVDVYAIDNNDWSETEITWNTAPVKDFSGMLPIASFTTTSQTSFDYYYIDVRDYIEQQRNAGETEITLAFVAAYRNYTVYIHSKEVDDEVNTNPPCLIVNEDKIAPSVPQNLQGEAISPYEVELTWDESTDNVAVDEYEIYMEGEKVETVTADESSGRCSCIIDNLQPSTWYTFYVKAIDSSQNVSEASATVTARTDHLPDDEPPTVPQNLTGKALSPTKIRLFWEPSTDNISIDGYIVYCDNVEIATIEEDGYTGYDVTGLSKDTSYTFSVEAFDLIGNKSGKSDEITVSTMNEPDSEPPEAPDNLRVDGLEVYSSEATLEWNAALDNIETTGYIIYVNGSEKARESGTSCQLSDLAPYTDYNIYIRAFDEAGNISEASDVLNFTTSCETLRTAGEGGDYATIQLALNAANPGDAVLIKAGTYTETLTINSSGTEDKWITITAEDGALVNGNITLNGSYIRLAGITMDGQETKGWAVMVKKPYTQVVGMNVQNYNADAIYFSTTSGNAYVADNYIYNSGGGFMTWSNSIFERNEIDTLNMHGRSSGDCNYFTVFGDNVIIRNNYTHGTVYGSHLYAAHVDFIQYFDNNRVSAKNILIENNFFSGFTHQGFMLSNAYFGLSEGIYYASDWTIRNNLVKDFTSWAITGGYSGNENGAYREGGIPNLLIENNTFIGDPTANGDMGAWYGIGLIGQGCSGIVRNNILMNIVGKAYEANTNAVLTKSENNLIYNAVDPQLSETDIVGYDPEFADPENNDYSLKPISPAIDTGAAVNFNYDLEGKLRPYGGAVDIGAYEFHGIKANTPPRVSVISPTAGQVFDIGDTVEFTVNAVDDVQVAKVEYFLDGEKAGESSTAPFSYSKSNMEAGLYTLYAIAYDEQELSTKSSELVFIVGGENYIIARSNTSLTPDSWGNVPITAQTGKLYAEFDMTLLTETMNGYIGLTGGADAAALGDIATIVRFKGGNVDACNGSAYPSLTEYYKYNVGKPYKLKLTVDIPSQKFSATLTDDDGVDHIICEDYAFRKTGLSSLDRIVAASYDGGVFAITDYNVQEMVAVTGIDIEEESITIGTGANQTLTVNVLPANATVKEVEWTSFNPVVATVNNNGVVTGISEGNTVIMATAAGTTFSDVCSVLVTSAQENLPPEFEAIGNKSVNVGSALEFTVSASDQDGDELTYSAEDLPDGANFDAETRTFNWNPTPQQAQENAYTVTFTVTDNENPPVQMTVNITVNAAMQDEYDFTINDVSIDKETGVAVEATITSNTVGGGNAVVIFKLMKNDGTVIGLTSSELYIEDNSVFKVKFHGYSGDEYKVKIFVWDELDDSTEDIGENLAEPVEIQ